MKKKEFYKLSFLILVVALLFACDHRASFIVNNYSGSDISNLNVQISQKNKNIIQKRMTNNQSIRFEIDLSHHKGDGDYFISFLKDGTSKETQQRFGYFTSSTPSEELITINILTNSLEIN